MTAFDEMALRGSFKEFFRQEPYNYQLEVAQHLLAGNSVVLQAPTGTGKTYTALFPFLYAWQYLEPREFPRKSIYSVERRILVNNFHAEVEKLLKNSNLKQVARSEINNTLYNATLQAIPGNPRSDRYYPTASSTPSPGAAGSTAGTGLSAPQPIPPINK